MAGDGHAEGVPTVSIGATNGSRPALWLDVQVPVLRLALQHVASISGHRTVFNPAMAAIRVADGLRSPEVVVEVLVASTTPLAARMALEALTAGVVRTVIQAEEPAQLAYAVTALDEGWATAPAGIVAAAGELPRLSSRQHALLGCVARGSSADQVVAAKLCVSAATVRREVQELYELLDVPDRYALAEKARHLGYGRQNWVSSPDGRNWLTRTCSA